MGREPSILHPSPESQFDSFSNQSYSDAPCTWLHEEQSVDAAEEPQLQVADLKRPEANSLYRLWPPKQRLIFFGRHPGSRDLTEGENIMPNDPLSKQRSHAWSGLSAGNPQWLSEAQTAANIKEDDVKASDPSEDIESIQLYEEPEHKQASPPQHDLDNVQSRMPTHYSICAQASELQPPGPQSCRRASSSAGSQGDDSSGSDGVFSEDAEDSPSPGPAMLIPALGTSVLADRCQKSPLQRPLSRLSSCAEPKQDNAWLAGQSLSAADFEEMKLERRAVSESHDMKAGSHKTAVKETREVSSKGRGEKQDETGIGRRRSEPGPALSQDTGSSSTVQNVDKPSRRKSRTGGLVCLHTFAG